MGTRSFIAIEIPSKQKGATVKFDKSKLPIPCAYGTRSKIDDSWTHIPYEPAERKSILLEKNYLMTYCQLDGNISNEGNVLFEKFKTEEQVLNLISGGFLSYIGDGSGYYVDISCRSDTPGQPLSDDFLAWQEDEEKELLSDMMICYVYLFKNGKWYVRRPCQDKKWYLLKNALNGHPDLEN